MITVKDLDLESIPRNCNFPFQVHGIGYADNNPPVRNVFHSFPNFIEINIRLRTAEAAPAPACMKFCGREYRLNYPHVIVKPPRTPYHYINLAQRDVACFIYSPGLYNAFSQLNLFQPPMAWEITLTPILSELLEQLNQFWPISSNFGIADNIDLICFQILSELLLQRNLQQKPVDPERENIMKIDSYLRTHFTTDIDWQELSVRFGFSRATFFRLWNKYMTDTPARFLLSLRLKEACRLLAVSRFHVNEIAQMVNISDYAYFCALFRRIYGMTPLQYRKQQMQS